MNHEKPKPKDNLIVDNDRYITSIPAEKQPKPITRLTVGEMKAIIPGQILDIRISAGQKVVKGDIMLILEAMKMRNRIYAEFTGIVEQVFVTVNERVSKGQLLLRIKPEEK